jgi:hypothetical protein
MDSTLTSRTATPCLAGALAMERQSVTAPDLGSVHGTRLPFAGMTVDVTAARGKAALGIDPLLLVTANRTAAQDQATVSAAAYVPGSPPRGGPV